MLAQMKTAFSTDEVGVDREFQLEDEFNFSCRADKVLKQLENTMRIMNLTVKRNHQKKEQLDTKLLKTITAMTAQYNKLVSVLATTHFTEISGEVADDDE